MFPSCKWDSHINATGICKAFSLNLLYPLLKGERLATRTMFLKWVYLKLIYEGVHMRGLFWFLPDHSNYITELWLNHIVIHNFLLIKILLKLKSSWDGNIAITADSKPSFRYFHSWCTILKEVTHLIYHQSREKIIKPFKYWQCAICAGVTKIRCNSHFLITNSKYFL